MPLEAALPPRPISLVRLAWLVRRVTRWLRWPELPEGGGPMFEPTAVDLRGKSVKWELLVPS